MGDTFNESRTISLLPLHIVQRQLAAAQAAAAAQAEAASAASEASLAAAEATALGTAEASAAAATAAEAAAAAETVAAAAVGEVAAAGAAALAAGGAIGQGLCWLIDRAMDPDVPLYPTGGKADSSSANDLEIDALCLLPPLNLPPAHRTVHLDRHYPGYGTILLSFLRCGIRAFVDGAQLVAAATVQDKPQRQKAATAFSRDLKDYAAALDRLADVIDHYPHLKRRLPYFSLAQAELLIDLASIGNLPRLIDYEGAIVQRMFELARVRSQVDIRPDIYTWLEQGMNAAERQAFAAAPFNALSVPTLLRVASSGLAAVDVSKSPLMR